MTAEREVTLLEIRPCGGGPPIRATVVKVKGKTAHVRHNPGMPWSKPWVMPVDRKTGRPSESGWAWRVSEMDLPL